MSRAIAIALLAMAALCGCGEKKSAERRLPMHGVVKSLDPAAKLANIDADKIDGWMEAMAMDYLVKPDSEFEKLHVGDKIQATVVIEEPKYYVTDIKVVK
jgi:Cu/Ag efflux protein CusF